MLQREREREKVSKFTLDTLFSHILIVFAVSFNKIFDNTNNKHYI